MAAESSLKLWVKKICRKLYLAQNLKYLREKNGETQKDIANMLFVTEMTISRYENGECEPNLQKVVDLAFHYL